MVVKDITEIGTYVGVPARLMNKMDRNEENNLKNKAPEPIRGGIM